MSPLGGTIFPPCDLPIGPDGARCPARYGVADPVAIAPGRQSATRAYDVRKRLAPLVSLVIAAVVLTAGCAGAAAPPDAYQQLTTSMKTTWNPIQVNVGLTVTAAGQTVTLDPADIAIVIDAAGGKGAVHISLPASDLGIPDSALLQLGIDGDSIEFDMVYAGDALYARSAMFKPVLKLVLGPAGKLPAGDLTGWLKLGTKDELAALTAISGSGAMPSVVPSSDENAATKASLEAAGITLTIVGTEKRNGADLQHLKVAVDMAKLATNPSFLAGAGGGAQAAQTAAMVKALSFTGDLWMDPTTHRIVESSAHRHAHVAELRRIRRRSPSRSDPSSPR